MKTSVIATVLGGAVAVGGAAVYLTRTNQGTNANVGQTNSAANANTDAGGKNVEAIKAVQNDLLGTWVLIADSDAKDEKAVFTADEFTYYVAGESKGTGKYRPLDEETLEVTERGKTGKSK